MSSADAHTVFFAVTGWLPPRIGFPATAAVGRIVALLLLSAGWVSLGMRVTRTSRAVLVAVLIFVTLRTLGWLSGEWVIGGVEGKVPAWGFAWLALSARLDRKWVRCGASTGLATSFHPVVGGWLVLSLLFGEIVTRARSGRPWIARAEYAPVLRASLVAALLAAPGLVPAIRLLAPEPVPPTLTSEFRDPAHMAATADYILVFGRLKHHLDPLDFPKWNWAWYGILTAVWAGSWTRIRRCRPDLTVLHAIVLAGCLFALAGLAIAAGPRPASEMSGYAWRARLLKLYPFRFIDVMLPLAVSLQTAALLTAAVQRTRPARWLLPGLVPICVLAVLSSRSPAEPDKDWVAMCRWIESQTPRDSLLVTPRESTDFKWYAQRAEFVNRKDCPQNAAGIVEWNRRLWLLQAWRQDSLETNDDYSSEDLRELNRLTSAEYLLTHQISPVATSPTHVVGKYRLYQLPVSE